MPNNSNPQRTEKIYFRIVGMKADLLSEYKKCVATHNVRSSEYKDTNMLVVSMELLNEYNYIDLLSFITKNKISDKSYGIYISLVTDRDNDGVHLPDYALKFYQLIGGNIDFSFVCG